MFKTRWTIYQLPQVFGEWDRVKRMTLCVTQAWSDVCNMQGLQHDMQHPRNEDNKSTKTYPMTWQKKNSRETFLWRLKNNLVKVILDKRTDREFFFISCFWCFWIFRMAALPIPLWCPFDTVDDSLAWFILTTDTMYYSLILSRCYYISSK